MDALVKRNMTKEERRIINNIVNRASKRKHRKQFDVEFICKHLEDHSFLKDWSYECRQDVIDMINSITEILLTLKYFTQKEAEAYINYYTEEYADNWFPED